MTISVRLDEETALALEDAAKAEGVSKSEYVRRRLRESLAQTHDGRLAWELGKDLFGKYASGRSDLSRNAKQIVREKIHAKKGAH